MAGHELQALGAALALAALHVGARHITPLGRIPRSGWLSAAAGVSVAYVFVHLLPELAAGNARSEREDPALGFLEDEVFVVGLLGLVVYYGVEKHSAASRRRSSETGGEDRTTDGAFWLSIGSFAVYNALVGHLLLREELAETSALVLYTFALGLHFVINDSSLRNHHKHVYDRVGRWLVAAGILVGWALGLGVELSEQTLSLVLAFLAGGVILNVFKEELPGEHRARLGPFVLAAAAYAALLQAA